MLLHEYRIAAQRKLHRKIMQKRNKNMDFTIIAQNCIGGVIYSDLGLQFLSPTINMFIEDKNFVKLVENLEYYLSISAEPLTEKYIDPVDNSITYPKIKIKDIEICCLHYKDCKEAIDAWERRKKRVNLNNVFVIGNSWNMHGNIELMQKICNSSYKSVLFSNIELDVNNCVYLKDDFWKLDKRGIIRPNITDFKPNSYRRYYEEYFDVVSWIN